MGHVDTVPRNGASRLEEIGASNPCPLKSGVDIVIADPAKWSSKSRKAPLAQRRRHPATDAGPCPGCHRRFPRN